MKKILFLSFLMLSLNKGVWAAELTPEDIVRKSDELLRGTKSYSELEMTIVKPYSERTYKMKAWTEGTEKALVFITSPAKEKGIGSLKIGHEMWNYIPKIDRVMKIPPSMMMQSWMGSDFTNDDLVKADSIVVDYNHTHIKDEKVDGEEVFVIQCDPKPEAAVVWGKIIVWIRKKGYVPLREELYNEKGEMVKLLTFSEIKSLSGREVPMEMVMENLKKDKHQTRIKYHVLDFNPVIKEDIFSLRELKRLGK